jgi:hypothetical protein
MINRERTLEVYGYDIDPSKRRRLDSEVAATNGLCKKDLLVVDNCPSCNIERSIKLRQSRKNKLCSKCFHNTPAMIETKRNQDKIKSEETKQRMRDNHFSKRGAVNFKGSKHTEEAKSKSRLAAIKQLQSYTSEQKKEIRIKASCTKRGIPLESFDGFSSPENTRIRQSNEGKAWTYDVLAKANFTCVRCKERGGSLNAHHKNAFNAFPEQRFLVDNGACLCDDCHSNFHSLYGKGSNTEDQFLEWLSK